MLHTLRPYQEELIETNFYLVNQFFTKGEKRKFLNQLPTGCGKTYAFAHIIKRMLPKRFLVLAHRQELLAQSHSTICEVCNLAPETVDIVIQSKPNPDAQGWVASIQTIVRGARMEQIKPDLIIIDEAHHSIAETYQKIMAYYPNVPILGFTATPTRTGKKEKIMLANTWDELVYQLPLKQAIRQGYLARINYFRCETDVSLDGVSTSHGDFNETQLGATVNVRVRNEKIVDKYIELGSGKAVAFCVTIEHADSLMATFRARGIEAYMLCEHTPSLTRESMLADFQAAPMDKNIVICNVMVLSEGWDCPNIRMIILARPTQSEIVYLQQLGRGTRKIEGKDSIIVLDVVDNCHKKQVCNALTQVFNLTPGTIVEGDVQKALDDEEEEKEKQLKLIKEKKVGKTQDITKLLMDTPIDLRGSGLAWVTLNQTEHVLQIAQDKYLKLTEDLLRWHLFMGKKQVLETGNLQDILNKSKEIAEQNAETIYMWNSRIVNSMDGKEASEGQVKLLMKLYPEMKQDGEEMPTVSRLEASKLISARLAKKSEEMATSKQIWKLRSLGYMGDASSISKYRASREIDRILKERECSESDELVPPNHEPGRFDDEALPF